MDKQGEILNILIQKGLLSNELAEEVKQITEISKKSLEEVLIAKKIVDYEQLAEITAKTSNMPYKNLSEVILAEDVLKIIPIEVAKNYKIICFGKEGNKISVGIVEPNNFKAFESINFLAKRENYKVEYFIISNLSFNIAYKQYKTLGKEISSALKVKAEEDAEELSRIEEGGSNLEEIAKTAPVAKIVSVIIRHAVDGRASDIHIEPLPGETRVRYRIDGILGTSLVLPKNIHNAIAGRIKVLANLKLDETRVPQDGRIRMIVSDKKIDLRVSTLPLLGGEKIVMRILDMTKQIPSLKELGFMGPGYDIISNNLKKTDGALLVTGPTGSGKSTTIFSIINEINKEGINISTLEDPVEYYVKGVNQSQIKPEIGFNFASGLRSLLRQDPDVIMVGEIRDSETAELAVHAGLTGHFVLSTLHTNDAIGAIPRLVDMDVEPFLLGSTLNAIVAQRLLRRICEHCKKEVELPSDIIAKIKNEVITVPHEYIKKVFPDFNIEKMKFYMGSGCSRCGNAGYMGRIVVSEVIDINDKVKKMIIDGGKLISVEKIKENQKFVSIRQDSMVKVLLGKTTIEEVLRVLYN